jgi:hypothetical protein
MMIVLIATVDRKMVKTAKAALLSRLLSMQILPFPYGGESN